MSKNTVVVGRTTCVSVLDLKLRDKLRKKICVSTTTVTPRAKLYEGENEKSTNSVLLKRLINPNLLY